MSPSEQTRGLETLQGFVRLSLSEVLLKLAEALGMRSLRFLEGPREDWLQSRLQEGVLGVFLRLVGCRITPESWYFTDGIGPNLH